MKNEKTKLKIFDSKKVLGFYIFCNFITIMTLLGSLISNALMREPNIPRLIEHAFYCLTAILFYNIPVALRVRYNVQIPSFVEIIVAFMSIAHFVIGTIFGFYELLIFDKILHTLSGVMFAFVGFSLVNIINSIDKQMLKLSPFFVALFSFCFALAIGYVWELFEFAFDSLLGVNMQRWQGSFYPLEVDGEQRLVSDYGQGSGLIDTMFDMVVNAIGAAGISLLGYIWLKMGSPKLDKYLIKKNVKRASSDSNAIANNTVETNIDTNTDTNIDTNTDEKVDTNTLEQAEETRMKAEEKA